MLTVLEVKLALRLARSVVFDVPQNIFGLFHYNGTLLTHTELAIIQNLQILFFRAALQLLILQSVHITRVVPSQVQNLEDTLVKFYAAADCPAK